jgi:predicted metal-binding protein
MMAAQNEHSGRAVEISRHLGALYKERGKYLVLTAGGCAICGVCGMQKNKVCAYPEKALASLEAYGVNVSRICEISGLKYINGENTVTYFAGIFLF